jgi:4-hydroxybenzoate polyprenyltransferase
MTARTAPSSVLTAFSIGRTHIVAIAAMGTFTFGWLFTGRHPWALAGVAAVDWFLVNLLNRVVDLPEDIDNRIAGTDFVAAHRRAILVVGFGVLLASFPLVHLLVAPATTPLRAAFHALGLAYNWPIFPGGRRIKQLFFWKNTASATGFMLTVFGYPLVEALRRGGLAPGVGPAAIAVSAGFFFLFELSYEVIYDLRDAPGDARAGVRTYPVVLGERGAARIIDALLGASVATLAGGYAAGAVPWRVFIMAVAPVVQWVIYRRALRRGVTSADCIGLTWLGAGLLVTYHLWILAGLPGAGA